MDRPVIGSTNTCKTNRKSSWRACTGAGNVYGDRHCLTPMLLLYLPAVWETEITDIRSVRSRTDRKPKPLGISPFSKTTPGFKLLIFVFVGPFEMKNENKGINVLK